MSTITRVIVFDLDDTLYLEREFALSGFEAVGAWWRQQTGEEGFAARCIHLFNSGTRDQIFDRVLRELDRQFDPDLIKKLATVYRRHVPSIALAEDALRFFATRRDDELFAIITDGPVKTQWTKVRTLGLDRKVQLVICTDEWGVEYRKPHPKAFETIEEWSGLGGSQLVYVADNATKDFVTPRKRGWRTVQILRSERVHDGQPPSAAHEPHSQIITLDELERALEGLEKRNC
ncbi:HAD family hydrolase [Sinorhizobium sp. NFACC03]|uniref:HAD family hydrolase n=1 Tax=Sinorhizobium sp. NFACC03 TaxID=1566295 RepID=UPI000884CCDC|nr:HAD family hydrolase [Sinorhizobium sp. NFACC03]SDA92736.1 putative hydrolase of the HAD superfamily [Sinorhizobium sp. NFACC03]